MKTPVLLVLTLAILLGIGDVMNNACKNSQHAWCAPTSEPLHHITPAGR